MGQISVAVRLAGRQARRNRVRAAAIVATIALPIAVFSALDVILRTTHLTNTEQVERQLGGAQALVNWENVGYGVQQAPNGQSQPIAPPSPGQSFRTLPPPPNLPAGLLPPGASSTPEADTGAYVVLGQAAANPNVYGVDIAFPALHDLVRLKAGRAPAALGEVAVTTSLAHQLHAGLGSRIEVPGLKLELDVVGIVHERYSPRDSALYTRPATAVAVAGGQSEISAGQWYVDSPTPITWTDVLKFNAKGFAVTSLYVTLHPPPADEVTFNSDQGPQPAVDHATSEVGGALLGAMVILEVVLLAGPAFAIGARRRRDELALIAASGGTRRHLLTLVAVDGIVLGGLAAVAGVTLGIPAALVVLAHLAAWTGEVPGAVTIRFWEIAALAVLAVVSGLLASVVPAFGVTKQNTAEVLRGRQRVTRLSWRPALAGVVLIASAVGLGAEKLDEVSSAGFPAPLILAAALAEIGLALATPAVLGLAERAANHLPLWTRLALRDASRNRSAAAPAVAAILAVVAGTAAALVYGSAASVHDRLTYQPSQIIGDGVADISSPGPSPDANAPIAIQQVRAVLPGATVLVLNAGMCSGASCRQLVQLSPPAPGCPQPQFQFSGGAVEGQGQMVVGLAGPESGCSQGISPSYLVESGPTAQLLIGGNAGRQAADALAAGEAVVLEPSLLYHGRVLLTMGPGAPSEATIPAVQVNGPQGASDTATIILPPSEAIRLGLQADDEQIYVKRASKLPAHEIKAADDALVRLGFQGLDIETGYRDHITGALWAVIGGDAFLVLGAAIAATVLIGVDSRDDLMTFAAVGAAPRSRRRLAVARAGVICLVGALFGTAAGLLPGVELVWRLRHENNLGSPVGVPLSTYPLTIPWIHLATVVLAAPAVAMLAAAATTRARLPIERRRIG